MEDINKNNNDSLDSFANLISTGFNLGLGSIENADPGGLAELLKAYPVGEFDPTKTIAFSLFAPETDFGYTIRHPSEYRKFIGDYNKVLGDMFGFSNIEDILYPEFDKNTGEVTTFESLLQQATAGAQQRQATPTFESLLQQLEPGEGKRLKDLEKYFERANKSYKLDLTSNLLLDLYRYDLDESVIAALKGAELENKQKIIADLIRKQKGIQLTELENTILDVLGSNADKLTEGQINELKETLETIKILKKEKKLGKFRSFIRTGEVEKEWWNIIVLRDVGKIFEGIADWADGEIISSGLGRFFNKKRYNQIVEKAQKEGLDSLGFEDKITYLIGVKKDLERAIERSFTDEILAGLGSIVDFAGSMVLSGPAGKVAKLSRVPTMTTKVVAKVDSLADANKVAKNLLKATGVFKPVVKFTKNIPADILFTTYIKQTPQLVDYATANVGVYKDISEQDVEYFIQQLDKGSSFYKAISKFGLSATLEAWIEAYGGDMLEKALVRGPLEKIFKKRLVEKFLSKKGVQKVLLGSKEFAQKLGWHGVLGEVLEEELSEIKEAILETDPTYFKRLPFVTKQGLRRMTVNLISSAAFGTLVSPLQRRHTALIDIELQKRPVAKDSKVGGTHEDKVKSLLSIRLEEDDINPVLYTSIRTSQDTYKAIYSTNKLLSGDIVKQLKEYKSKFIEDLFKDFNPKRSVEIKQEVSQFLTSFRRKLGKQEFRETVEMYWNDIKQFNTIGEWLNSYGATSSSNPLSFLVSWAKSKIMDEEIIAERTISELKQQIYTTENEKKKKQIERRINLIQRKLQKTQDKLEGLVKEIRENKNLVKVLQKVWNIETSNREYAAASVMLLTTLRDVVEKQGIDKQKLGQLMLLFDVIAAKHEKKPIIGLIDVDELYKVEQEFIRLKNLAEKTAGFFTTRGNEISPYDTAIYYAALVGDRARYREAIKEYVKFIDSLRLKTLMSRHINSELGEFISSVLDDIKRAIGALDNNEMFDSIKQIAKEHYSDGNRLPSLINVVAAIDKERINRITYLEHLLIVDVTAYSILAGTLNKKEIPDIIRDEVLSRVEKIRTKLNDIPQQRRRSAIFAMYTAVKSQLDVLGEVKALLSLFGSSDLQALKKVMYNLNHSAAFAKFEAAILKGLTPANILIAFKDAFGIDIEVRFADIKKRHVLGYHHPVDDVIVINKNIRKYPQLTASIMLHEISHYLVSHQRDRFADVRDEIGRILNSKRSVYQNVVNTVVNLILNTDNITYYQLEKAILDKHKKEIGSGADAIKFIQLIRATLLDITTELDLVRKWFVLRGIQPTNEALSQYLAEWAEQLTSFDRGLTATEVMGHVFSAYIRQPQTMLSVSPHWFYKIKNVVTSNANILKYHTNLIKGVLDKNFYMKTIIKKLIDAGIYSDILVHVINAESGKVSVWDNLVASIFDRLYPLEKLVRREYKRYGIPKEVEENIREIRTSYRYDTVWFGHAIKFLREYDRIRSNIKNVFARMYVHHLVGKLLALDRLLDDKRFIKTAHIMDKYGSVKKVQLSQDDIKRGINISNTEERILLWYESKMGELGLLPQDVIGLSKSGIRRKIINDVISSIADDDIKREILDSWEQYYKDTKTLMQKMTKYMLKLANDYGLISDTTYKKLLENKSYVRYQRLSKLLSGDYKFKEVIGSLDALANPIDATFTMFRFIVKNGLYNKRKYALVDTLRTVGLAIPTHGISGNMVYNKYANWKRIKYYVNGKKQEYFIPKYYWSSFVSTAASAEDLGIFKHIGKFVANTLWVYNLPVRITNVLFKDMLSVFIYSAPIARKGKIGWTRYWKSYFNNLFNLGRLRRIAALEDRTIIKMAQDGLLPSPTKAQYFRDWLKTYSTFRQLEAITGGGDTYKEEVKLLEGLYNAAKDGDADAYLKLEAIFHDSVSLNYVKQYIENSKKFWDRPLEKIRGLWDNIEMWLNGLEFLHKVTFYEELKRNKNIDDIDRFMIINFYAGNPDVDMYRAKLGTPLGILFPFYQTHINSLRFLLEALRGSKVMDRPTMLAMLTAALLPNAMYYAAMYGIFDKLLNSIYGCDQAKGNDCEKIKSLFSGIGENEIKYYWVIPIGSFKSPLYIRIPKPPQLMLFTKPFNLVTKLSIISLGYSIFEPQTEEYKKLKEHENVIMEELAREGVTGALLEEMLPSLNPIVEIFVNTFTMLRNQEPIDNYTGRKIVTKDEILYKPAEAWLKLGMWSIEKLGAGSYIRLSSIYDDYKFVEPEDKIKFIFSNTIGGQMFGRFVKRNKSGVIGEMYETSDSMIYMKAKERRERYEKLEKIVEKAINTLNYEPVNGDPTRFDALWKMAVIEIWGVPYGQLPEYEKPEARALKRKLRDYVTEIYNIKHNPTYNKLEDKTAFLLKITVDKLNSTQLEKNEELANVLRIAARELNARQYKKYVASLYELQVITPRFLKQFARQEPELFKKYFVDYINQ